ncbi:MAG: carotenoid biosynthesis protein [Bacteroides sp.]|nr:carotenoid biosynthesis protein [Bacteroides sp.]
MAGVNTGIIFGNYRYGEGLGPKLYGTPLIIGLNWLYLTYSTHDIASRIFRHPVTVIAAGAGLMVIYDIVLEQVAPLMQMWSFASIQPPLANYIVWFLLALVFHKGFYVGHIPTGNYPARMLFYIQLLFLY